MSNLTNAENMCSVVGCNGVAQYKYIDFRKNSISGGSTEDRFKLCHGHAVEYSRRKTAFLMGET